MEDSHHITRRRFLGQAACAALGTSGLLSTLVNLGLATRVSAAEPSDYKAIICLFLLGGNDSFNLLAPTSKGEYNVYSNSRGGLHDAESNPAGLALPFDKLLKIRPGAQSHKANRGRSFGLHPSTPELRALYEQKQLSMVSNIGSLSVPFRDAEEYAARKSDWPVGLFSHSDQQQQWQTCIPDGRHTIGWAGRAMDLLRQEMKQAEHASFNISLSGMNILQTGNQVVPYVLSADELVRLKGYSLEKAEGKEAQFLSNRVIAARSEAIRSMLNPGAGEDGMQHGVYQNIFEQSYAQATRDAETAFGIFNEKLKTDAYPAWNTENASPLERQLWRIANVISSFSNTATKRQTFFVSLGGFDMHGELIETQASLMENVSRAIGKFWDHLDPALKSKVTLFTASDFGRTLSTNGQGSDHAWGGNHFVLGGGINGGEIFGEYPLFASTQKESAAILDPTTHAKIDVGQGRLIPSYSVEEYLYPILKWFGVSDRDLFETVFPGYSSRFEITKGIRKEYPLYS